MIVNLAQTYFQRAKGLLGLDSSVFNGKVLLITNCKSIHTIGMKESIDVAFIAKDGMVLKSVRNLKPGVPIILCKKACCVLERFASNKNWYNAGDYFFLNL
ncbi:MAG: DUF192 domain-containing protein [Coriobacteriales bacterium]|nr:DUF192 domain-containing protein [Coriobacteriales bacterium]